MPTIKFGSWNIEHFKGNKTRRVNEMVRIINDEAPDIFSIMEVEDLDVVDLARNRFPGHDFFVTDGPNTMEILVGVRRGAFDGFTFTQKREFKAGNRSLRPGALLSATLGADIYNFLFLHMDSGPKADDFGNRFEMLSSVRKLKRALTRKLGSPRLIVAGDLNTMGLHYPTGSKRNERITEEEEIAELAGFAELNVAVKETDATFLSDRFESALDHVLFSEDVTLQTMGVRSDTGEDFQITLRGWPDKSTRPSRLKFAENIADHAAIFGTIVT